MENKFDLTQMTVEELKALQEAIQKELDSRKPTKVFKIEITNFDPRKHGHAYVARLTNKNGKIEREFFNGERLWDSKHKEYDITFEFELKEGDIIETREGGSWKNDYRYWYQVRNGELVEIERSEALKLVKEQN